MSVLVDQLLFGYRDGHELLEGSLVVEPRMLTKVLPHTDARFDDEAPHYLVGTPLPELERFLLARIWPAPERPRPGAVWTHALLLTYEALARLDPVALVSAFRRPARPGERAWGKYDVPLKIERSPFRSVEAPEPLMLALCSATYEASPQGSVIVWEGDAEKALLAVWRRQPAAARFTFSFRTRGRARTGSSPYAIQVASTLAGRSGSEGVAVLDARRVSAGSAPAWIRQLSEASLEPGSAMGPFLDDFANSRSDVATLAQTWILMRDPATPRAVADFLVERYPEPESREDLKVALFGGSDREKRYWTAEEKDLVICLLATDGLAFNFASLRVAERTDELWRTDARGQLVALFDDRDRLAPVADSILLQTGARHLEPLEVAERALDRRLMAVVANERPDVFATTEFWEAVPTSAQESVLALATEALEHRDLVKALVGIPRLELVGRTLDHGVDVLVVAPILIRHRDQDLAAWTEVFAGREHELGVAIENAARVDAEVVLRVAAFIPYDQAQRVSLERWLPAARLAHGRLDPIATTAAANLLMQALPGIREPARQLLIEVFGPVHRALELGEVDAKTWTELDDLLPDRRSDPAKRLRRALIASMNQTTWEAEELARALAPAGPEAKRLVKLVGKKHPLRRLIETAVEDLVSPLRG